MSVQLVKMLNNELLIGNVTENDDSLTIDKPFQVGVINDQLAFIDFNNQLGDCDTLTIALNHVLYRWEANEDVKKDYISRSSGIELATSNAPELDLSNLTS